MHGYGIGAGIDMATVITQIAKYMGPTWVLSAPDGSHVGPMNLAIRETSDSVADTVFVAIPDAGPNLEAANSNHSFGALFYAISFLTTLKLWTEAFRW